MYMYILLVLKESYSRLFIPLRAQEIKHGKQRLLTKSMTQKIWYGFSANPLNNIIMIVTYHTRNHLAPCLRLVHEVASMATYANTLRASGAFVQPIKCHTPQKSPRLVAKRLPPLSQRKPQREGADYRKVPLACRGVLECWVRDCEPQASLPYLSHRGLTTSAFLAMGPSWVSFEPSNKGALKRKSNLPAYFFNS